jgi:rubrerythrin
MELSREQIEQIASSTAQNVLENLHRYAVEYKAPSTIEEGLRDSMIEEKTATDWYMKRAKHARSMGDEATGGLYNHIAEEEEKHYREFARQLPSLDKGKELKTIIPITAEELFGKPHAITDQWKNVPKEEQDILLSKNITPEQWDKASYKERNEWWRNPVSQGISVARTKNNPEYKPIVVTYEDGKFWTLAGEVGSEKRAKIIEDDYKKSGYQTKIVMGKVKDYDGWGVFYVMHDQSLAGDLFKDYQEYRKGLKQSK